jgi:lipase chaperone LimK
MTVDLDEVLREYRAGLEAEMALLHRLERLDTSRHDATSHEGVIELAVLADEREKVMVSLVNIEHTLKPLRAQLVEARATLQGDAAFQDVAQLHQRAADLVARILATDSRSLQALKDAEHARRFAAESMEKGESTLAAYRRVVAPPVGGSRIVNRRG